ncbi:MAG: glycosyltransferase family 4 protein, partial [Sinomicrobium sp.]|nr:glycosyltransferase family 4 protein [Sinomicrobium sp.]
MRKKIIIVDNSTWNIYNFRLSLIKKLKAEGYLVVVVAPVDKYIHYLNESYFTKHIPLRYLSPQTRNGFRDLMFVWELFRIFRSERPDLVLNYTIKPNIFGNLAARLAGVPSLATITGLGYTFLNRGIIHFLVPWLYYWAFRKVRKVVFYNPDDREEFIKRQIVPAEKSTVIPGSGVNTNHFRPLPKSGTNKFVFLFIGRLLYDKGLREYVEAARQICDLTPDAECWVIGEFSGKYPNAVTEKQLLTWIAAKHIRYFGEAQDVRKYIKQANVVVLPSYREGVPRSLLEAMSMCKPIITTATAGC